MSVAGVLADFGSDHVYDDRLAMFAYNMLLFRIDPTDNTAKGCVAFSWFSSLLSILGYASVLH